MLPLVVVGLILWVGCSNVANLLLARAAARRKEIAIRMANGAGRARLIRLLLTESVLLALAGGAAGVLLAVWCRDLIWAVLPEAPRLAVEIDLNVLLYTGAVCVAATMLFGLVPALHATRIDVAPLLKSDDARRRQCPPRRADQDLLPGDAIRRVHRPPARRGHVRADSRHDSSRRTGGIPGSHHAGVDRRGVAGPRRARRLLASGP